MTKVFADTNIFLRFLAQDVPEQTTLVQKAFAKVSKGELTLITTPMVFAELAWTLASFYKYDKTQIVTVLLAIINTPGIELEARDRVIQALAWYEHKNVDFIDAYNAAWLLEQPVRDVLTFDTKHFKRFEHINIVKL